MKFHLVFTPSAQKILIQRDMNSRHPYVYLAYIHNRFQNLERAQNMSRKKFIYNWMVAY